MKREELIAAVAKTTNQTQVTIGNILESIEHTIESTLAKGEDVQLAMRFGRFVATTQVAKTGKVPGQPGKTYSTPEKLVPKFKASSALKESVAGIK